jgi:flagellar hook protein FlgE
LNANSSALNTIANNLANLNTDGYKDETVSFGDIFYKMTGTSGNGDPLQTGTGVRVAGTSSNFNSGTVSSTGVASNLALAGNGFFVVQQGNQTNYTRSGDFSVNSSGQLSTPSGELVMGYPATNGVISTGSALAPIQVGQGVTIPGTASSTFLTNTNLDASADIGASAPGSPLTVYDSLGTSHVLSIQYTKTGANSWSYSVTLPAADTGQTGAASIIGSGTMSFDTSGKLISPTGTIPGLNIANLADGAGPMSLTWNLTDASNNSTITQLASASTTSSTSQNGFGVGTISGYSVLADGTVQGQFNNGQNMALGQVAVASFSNVEGLARVGNNDYQSTFASGGAVVGQAGSGGRGTITGSSVELSNVDISGEFAKMIVAQQGYEANAKVLTTFNQISQATIQLIT